MSDDSVNVKRPFLRSEKKFILFGKEGPKEELKEPVLFLMHNNGTIDIIENVNVGFYKIKRKDGTEKAIYLDPSKLHSLKYNKQRFRTWMAYEDEAVPYPVKVKHVSETFYRLINKVALDYKNLDEAKNITARTKQIVMVVMAIAIGGAILFSMMPQIKGAFA